mgnify:CR=1 FL=1
MPPAERGVERSGRARTTVRAAGVVETARDRLDGCFLWVVGDRTGGALFLGALLVYALGWQAGIVIVDTYAVANGLVAVADGHLFVERVVFGPGFDTPGMHYVDGRFYARNYGQIVAALPLYWLLEGVDAVAELRVAIAGLWSLCLVAFAGTLATLREDRRLLLAGALAALVAFLANLWTPTPVPDTKTPILALQLLAILSAGLCGVVTYRLLRRIRTRRVGLLGGALVALATPVAFWATIPKRHTLTTAVVLSVAYLLYRSRSAERAAPRDPTTLRAGMYALVGLFTWVHAPVALTLFLPLAAIDVTSAPSNAPRDLAVVGAAFLAALVPFFLTNYLISGNPVQAPRLLPNAGKAPAQAVVSSGDTVSSVATSDGAVGAPSGGTETGPTVPFLAPLLAVVSAVGPMLDEVLGVYLEGAVTVVREPVRLSQVTLVSRGDIPLTAPGSVERASNLSMLESTPLVGAALALPFALVLDRLRSPGESRASATDTRGPSGTVDRVRERVRGGLSPTDAFLLAFSTLLVLVYLPRLPLRGQITVRYLTPLYPVAVYLVCKHGRLGDALTDRLRTVAYAYEATVLLGVPTFLAALLWLQFGEPAAFDALAGIGVVAGVALFAGAVLVATVERGEGLLAGLVGVAAGTTTGFVLLSQLVFFHYGIHLLPVVQVLTEAFRTVLVRMAV